ncbi:MAG: hypothetical protein NTY38_21615, partial [Acidobacteria bacterium]|nr:hypothetical protein [Acidobacteriota bacterium]
LWYLGWVWGALFVASVAASPGAVPWLNEYLGYGLLGAVAYWQLMPLMMASTGAALDLKRLLVYPIPHRDLYQIELLLRITTGAEAVLMMGGLGAGLLVNPVLPKWGLPAIPVFILFNLCLAAALRGILRRIFERRGTRELAVLFFVMIAALPQLVVALGIPAPVQLVLLQVASAPWPWTLAAHSALGERPLLSLAGLCLWTAGAWLFGRRQFERSLQFDAQSPGATLRRGPLRERWAESFYRLPSRLFRDPLGGLIEKELRFLTRSPRFRLVFLMGFTFGLFIWLPAAHRQGQSNGNFLAQNYLVFVSAYAVLLLGEVCFWNAFGFDRSAVQFYFVAPLDLRTVLRAKNITASFFVLLEITTINMVCLVLGLSAGWLRVVEAYAVALVLALFFVGLGNLGSVYYPRPIDPAQSWRSSSPGRFQAYLLLLLPVMGAPVALAFLGRYAFDSELAFFVVLAGDAAVALVVYWMATDSAVTAAIERREMLIETLSRTEGPITG